jgi:Arm DNA-binding domain
MRVSLTDRFCAGVKAKGQTDYFDEQTSGLALRVTGNGIKAWTLVFSSPRDGKRARLTLGRYPQTTLAQARTLALEAKGHLDQGNDPRNAQTGAMTVAALVPLYLEKPHRKTGKPRRGVKQIKRRLDTNVLPIIGGVKLSDLHRTLSVYSHYDYAKEKREALELWADRLQGIVAGGAEIVPMRSGR